MDIIVMAAIGWIVGWLVNQGADYLPRFSSSAPAQTESRFSAPAIWEYMMGRPGDESVLHLSVEALTTLAFIYAGSTSGISQEAFLIAGGLAFFLLVAVIDLKYRLIPNVITFPAIAALLVAHLLFGSDDLGATLIGGGFAFFIFFSTAMIKPGRLGGGDIKFAVLIGLAFGFPSVLWALIIGVGSGGVAALILLVTRRAVLSTRIPYAPFLSFGAVVALLYNPFF
jgi:prepilin signal peptidase PulO-like enzyme (type II secretory pathway)